MGGWLGSAGSPGTGMSSRRPASSSPSFDRRQLVFQLGDQRQMEQPLGKPPAAALSSPSGPGSARPPLCTTLSSAAAELGEGGPGLDDASGRAPAAANQGARRRCRRSRSSGRRPPRAAGRRRPAEPAAPAARARMTSAPVGSRSPSCSIALRRRHPAGAPQAAQAPRR